jgi:alkanesulfonate monooxygenase SsuD/methylene tetrahydromethanopterin reductase-like flavin-dependent oxidoreductase (luciferase family)
VNLGIFSVLDAYPPDAADRVASRIESVIALAREADRLGYHSFWVGEHHFQTAGVSPSPPVLLAALARETRRLRLGSLVAVLPLHAARALAEEYALADVLSAGRIEIGIGSGYSPLEFYGFALDPRGRREAFDRGRVDFLSALRGESWPAPGAPSGEVSLNVRPRQRPLPPIWTAAVRREAVCAVGERGDRLALIPYASLDRIADLGGIVRAYRATLPPGAVPRVLVALHVYIGADRRRAEAALDRFLSTRPAPESPAFRERLEREPELGTARGLVERGLALLGSWATVRRSLDELPGYGVTDLAAIVDFGGTSHRNARATIRRLAEWRPARGSLRRAGQVGADVKTEPSPLAAVCS